MQLFQDSKVGVHSVQHLKIISVTLVHRQAVTGHGVVRIIVKGKGKVFPLQARCGPEGG